ncbi:uncharacterized protein BDW43DRAFT_266452 [Aspergillus alliaceus]|uniref:uncharacterized protein n=1 Tax=Petromyces alliaceus TaxID=209559 RepID=UPI0012A668B2|nr:uncharacterized protein BDW43DRAFT_266452 [Aspergillus alliaceus]KAB8236914.1 hypothetical protein BDW43DRAFT_266452 [Aspergillus alliaceus]
MFWKLQNNCVWPSGYTESLTEKSTKNISSVLLLTRSDLMLLINAFPFSSSPFSLLLCSMFFYLSFSHKLFVRIDS